MTQPAYTVARAVAPSVAEHLRRHLAALGEVPAPIDLPDLGLLPDARVIESMVDAAFWASVRREEGYIPKISLAFGAKIGRRDGGRQVEQIVVTEPVEGGTAERMHPGQLGGTRHLSAAQFVQDQPDALALVASQDGRFTLFAWSPCDEAVHAHRVETLLL